MRSTHAVVQTAQDYPRPNMQLLPHPPRCQMVTRNATLGRNRKNPKRRQIVSIGLQGLWGPREDLAAGPAKHTSHLD